MTRFDVLYGVKDLQPEFSCRLIEDPSYRWWHWRSLLEILKDVSAWIRREW